MATAAGVVSTERRQIPHRALTDLAAYVITLWLESMLPMEAIAHLAWWEGWLERDDDEPPGRDAWRVLERLADRYWSNRR